MTRLLKVITLGLFLSILSCSAGPLPTVKPNSDSEFNNTSSCSKETCPAQARNLTSSVHIEIDPSAAGYLPQQIFNLSTVKNLPAQFEIKPRFFYHGTLAVRGSLKSNTAGVDSPEISDITALVPDIIAIPKAEDNLSESAAAILTGQQNNSSSIINADTGYFTLSLIADQKYQIVINPEGKNAFPPTFLQVQISTDHSETITLKNEGSIVAGRITLPFPLLLDLVKASSVKILQGKKLVSSVGRLTSNGNFSVQLSSPLSHVMDRNHKLTLVIEPDSEHNYLPVIREKLSLKEDELENSTIHLEPITVNGTNQIYNKSLIVVNEQGEPVKDIRIYLKRKLDGYFIEKQLQTDDKGQAKIKLLKGSYNLATVAPQDSVYGMYRNDDWNVESDESITITLPLRQELHGTLLDYSGNPVDGSLIQLTRIAQEDSSTLEGVLKKTSLRIEARSNHDGQWCTQSLDIKNDGCAPLRLDQGKYRLFIIPPPGGKLPYQTMTFDFPKNNVLSITLKKPTQISGRVVSPGSTVPISKAFIKIFSASLQLESGEPLLLGQAITDEEGRFSAFIYLAN